MQKTNISYLDFTWNPGCGCPLPLPSAGCIKCWARGLHDKRHRAYLNGKKLPIQYAKPFHELQFFDDRLTDPVHRKQPAIIGVQFMGDLFAFPFEWIDRVFAVMALCPQHRFMCLTKRAGRMREYMEYRCKKEATGIPLPNVHLGVTVENQDNVWRIADLDRTPAAKRVVSFEPLLAPVDVKDSFDPDDNCCVKCGYIGDKDEGCEVDYETPDDPEGWKICPNCEETNCGGYPCYDIVDVTPFNMRPFPDFDYALIGCESGPNARLCTLDDIRHVMDQCRDADVKVHIKQVPLIGKCNKHFNEWPKQFQVREV